VDYAQRENDNKTAACSQTTVFVVQPAWQMDEGSYKQRPSLSPSST